MLPLFLDEDSLSRALVRGLHSKNIDVLTAFEASRREASDEEQLAFATSRGRPIYTSNVDDFARLHRGWLANGRHHAGIIVLADQRTDVGVQIRALVRLCNEIESTSMRDRLEFLGNWTEGS